MKGPTKWNTTRWRKELIETDYHIGNDIQDRPLVAMEMANLLCGKLLNRGITRWVFVNNLDPTTVVKIEMQRNSSDPMFQNAVEWMIWNWVKGESLEKWFAPCTAVSTCGRILIQKRVKPFDYARYPKRLPGVFSDTKYENFGLYKNHIVACDYGTMAAAMLSSFMRGNPKGPVKMKPVKWWGGATE